MTHQTEVIAHNIVKTRVRTIGTVGDMVFKIIETSMRDCDDMHMENIRIVEKRDNFKRIRVLSSRSTRITNQKTKKPPCHITRNRK